MVGKYNKMMNAINTFYFEYYSKIEMQTFM